jgi:DNA-directed RNA polymerase subunit K/omega
VWVQNDQGVTSAGLIRNNTVDEHQWTRMVWVVRGALLPLPMTASKLTVSDIVAERARQIRKGYNVEHDALYRGPAELEEVAAYLLHPDVGAPSDWAVKIKTKWAGNFYRLTIIAAALLVAAAELRRAQSIA